MTDAETQRELDAMPANREEQYTDLFTRLDLLQRTHAYDDDTALEDVEEEIEQSVLAVSRTNMFEVTISTGGPGEWLECYVDASEPGSTELTRVDFVCAWWSTPQRTTVREGSGLWRLAERMNPYQF